MTHAPSCSIEQLQKVGNELRHTQLHVRILSFLLSCSMLFDLLDPALFILTVPTSIVHKIANLVQAPEVLGATFIILAVFLLPFLLMQIFCPNCPARRDVTRLACFGLLAAGVLWMFLAWMTRNMDIGPVTGVYLRTGLGAFGFSFCLALSLNSEQARKLLEEA